jgi:type II secretory pathway component PulF
VFKSYSAKLFFDLATLTEAGISITDACKRLADDSPDRTEWLEIISLLEKGTRFSLALGQSGMINRYEQEIISIAEHAGRVEQALRQIANSCELRESRINRLKTKLYYPMAIFIVGVIVSAILQLSKNPELPIFALFFSVLTVIVIVLWATRTLLKLMQKDAFQWLNLARRQTDNQWYQKLFQQVVFGSLLWSTTSGIDYKTGFTRVSKLIGNKVIQKKLYMTAKYCEQGLTVSDAVMRSQLPIHPDFKHILITGERSGRWDYAVGKYLEDNQRELDSKIDDVFEWTPRLYYFSVAIFALIVVL